MSSDTTHKGSESENPVVDAPEPKAHGPLTLQDWWPDQIDVSKLHPHAPQANPLGENFDYSKEFAKLDVEALKADVFSVMTVVGGPPVLRGGHHRDQVGLERVDVEFGELLGVVEVLSERVGLRHLRVQP